MTKTFFTTITWGTFVRGVSFVALQTHAGHRSHGQRIQDRALGVDAARVLFDARVLAYAGQAGRLRGAIPVGGTTDDDLFASRSASAFVSRWAVAFGLMVFYRALGRSVAWVLDGARILTSLVDANLIRGTGGVVCALNGRASHIRITLQSSGANADMFVVDSAANSVSTARQVVHSANGGTFAEAAGVGSVTFVV